MEERLRKFAKLAETKSFTKAASVLHTSQPALSIAIAKLERELDHTLIDRTTLQLTAAGELAYEYAQKLDLQANNFKSDLKVLAQQKPSISIGLIDSLAETLLIGDGQLAKLGEQAQVKLSINNSRYLLDSLEHNNLDVIYIVRPSKPLGKKFKYQVLDSEPLIAVTATSQITDVQQAMAQGILPNFLAYDEKSQTNQLIQQYFSSQQIQLQNIFHSTSPEIILQMALAGQGSAVLPYALLEPYLKRGDLITFGGIVERRIIAIWHQDKPLHKAITTLNDRAEQLLKNQSAAAEQLVNTIH